MSIHRNKNGGNDAYFTKPELAERYVKIAKDILKNRKIKHIVEPSAGNGSFVKPLLAEFDNIMAYDIEPLDKKDEGFRIIKEDFFNVDVPKNSLVIGNPPFGFASNLAIKFFNHAAKNAKSIAFIVPKTFCKESVQSKLDKRFHLIFEEHCPKNSFLVDGEEYDVPCVFQIWLNYGIKKKTRTKSITYDSNPYFKFVTKNEADFCLRRVGGKSGKILDGLNHTESSTYFCKSLRQDYKQAIESCYQEFTKINNLTAGVKSLSKNEINRIMCQYYEKANGNVKLQ